MGGETGDKMGSAERVEVGREGDCIKEGKGVKGGKVVKRRPPTAAQLRAIYRDVWRSAPRSFVCFLIVQDKEYRLQWFQRLIAERVEALLRGEIRRLMIFIPPQCGKSTIVSKCFPAWALGCNPDLRIVCCSYSATLAVSFSRQVQRLMSSDFYRTVFPQAALPKYKTALKKRTGEYFDSNNGRGFYKAVGVGGSLTGTPADIAIIDDPVKDAAEAYSEVYRNKVWDWYNSVLSTRLHNDSKQLFIMTRWHEDDLAGRILEVAGSEWEVLKLPAICEEAGDGGLSSRCVGEALWEGRHSLESLLSIKERAPREFSALYQQSPTPAGGNIIKVDWLPLVRPDDFFRTHRGEPVFYFLDTAYTAKERNDPSGIIAACMVENVVYILDGAKVNLSFPDLCKFVERWCMERGYNAQSRVYIEPKANGISVIDQLRRTTHLSVCATPSPKEDKVTRLNTIAPVAESGRVKVLERPFARGFIDEVTGFPSKPHDEYVDVLCYAVGRFIGTSGERIDLRKLAERFS